MTGFAQGVRVVVVLKRLGAAVRAVPLELRQVLLAPLVVIGSVVLGHPLIVLAAVLWMLPRLPQLLFVLLYPETLKSHDSAPSMPRHGSRRGPPRA